MPGNHATPAYRYHDQRYHSDVDDCEELEQEPQGVDWYAPGCHHKAPKVEPALPLECRRDDDGQLHDIVKRDRGERCHDRSRGLRRVELGGNAMIGHGRVAIAAGRKTNWWVLKEMMYTRRSNHRSEHLEREYRDCKMHPSGLSVTLKDCHPRGRAVQELKT